MNFSLTVRLASQEFHVVWHTPWVHHDGIVWKQIAIMSWAAFGEVRTLEQQSLWEESHVCLSPFQDRWGTSFQRERRRRDQKKPIDPYRTDPSSLFPTPKRDPVSNCKGKHSQLCVWRTPQCLWIVFLPVNWSRISDDVNHCPSHTLTWPRGVPCKYPPLPSFVCGERQLKEMPRWQPRSSWRGPRGTHTPIVSIYTSTCPHLSPLKHSVTYANNTLNI